MSSMFVAFAGAGVDDPVHWRLLSAQGRIIERGYGDLNALPKVAASEQVLVLQGEFVTARRIQISARSERQAQTIAPYALEDDLAVDVETIHTALAPPDATPDRIAYAVDETYLAEWLSAARTNGLDPARICPDYVLLSDDDRLLVGGFADRALIKHGNWGAAVDGALGEDMVRAVVVQIQDATGAAAEPAFLSSDSLDELYDRMASTAARSSVNLRQGRHALKTQASFDLGIWRAPMALSALALFGAIGFNFAEGAMLRSAAEELKADTAAELRAKFPEIRRVVNVRAQMRAALNGTGAGDPDFLVLSSMLASAADQAENLSIESLRFDAANGEIRASVVFSAYDDLAALKSSLEAAGGVVEEGASRQSGAQRVGEIVVRRGS